MSAVYPVPLKKKKKPSYFEDYNDNGINSIIMLGQGKKSRDTISNTILKSNTVRREP